MSAHMRGLVLALIGLFALAECTATDPNSHADGPPASPQPVASPRAGPKTSAAPNSVAVPKPDQSAANWRHLPQPVSIEQLNQDKANCTKLANGASGAGSPEMKFYLTFTNCMRSAGYEQNNSTQ
jgi:hypothetical protein